MPPEEDARAILRLALRHEQSLGASLDPAFAQENWGFLAQQCVENLLKGLIVLAGEQPPLSHDLERLQQLAGVRPRQHCRQQPRDRTISKASPPGIWRAPGT